uniref:Transposon protein, putative, unclassified n=1 Tax=Oryza sativa subsp. japonica TaxID=39947 RepID=Q10LB4_ORYSJ|nr:transposon protein, putative, unclassified [Oryza sativa Japonica Group]
MSWHRAGVLLLGAQSCLPVPGVPAVGGIGSVLLSMARTEPQTKPYPLDMWKYGSALQQRPEDRSLYGRGATIKTMHP